MENRRQLVASFLTGVLFLSVVSCSDEKPRTLTAAEDARERLNTISAKYETSNSEATSSKTTMPEWAPDGFPFPRSTIVLHHTGNLHGGAVNLKSDQSLESINQFYLEAMPKDGWEKGATRKKEYYYLFKKEGKEAILTLSKEPGDELKTRIKLTFIL